ncbi:RHS repeat domain-containing protein [Mucilaginibacter sp. UC70_90]
MIDKNLGSTNVGNTAWLQSVDMRYNIHGQLLSINNSKLSNDGVKNDDSNDLFGMEMLYEQADANLGNTKRYNGNLSGVKWMSRDATGTAGNERAYKYLYDGRNRYVSANYIERATAATGAFDTNSAGFSENGITYDEGGNILTLKRNTITTTGSITGVDNLTYTYDTANPNQLKTVTDGTGTNYTGFGFRNLTGTTTGNYTYDVNGNMTADPYKGLTINYNVLNRTDKITVTTSTGRYINYTYDAGGTLVRKQAYDNNLLGTTTDYVDGFVYLNGVISYFAMPEGRVRNIGSGTTVTLKQEFIVTDQQGNARISFEDNGIAVAVVRQENSYYGFGLTLANSPVATPVTDNKQLYNGGSEWQNDYNNLPDLQQTFYRNYDAALGRWIAVDPVAESAESMTVYQYAGNNPIMMNDPLGDKLPSEGSGITLDWTTNATPYVPHRSLFGSGIDPTILQAGEMYASGNGYGNYSALWVNIFKASGYNVDKNGIATISNPDPKLSVDYYVDAEGKLIAKSSYDGGRGGAHYYGVTVTGTDHGKAKYVVNDEISYDEVGVRRLTANAQKWLADYHEFQQSVGSGLSSAWNSDFGRWVINDDMGIHLSGVLVPTVGGSYSLNLDLITRGKDAGLYFSHSVSARVGEEGGLSLNLVRGNYQGEVRDITVGSLFGWGADVNASFVVGMGKWASYDEVAHKATWFGSSISFGPSVGGSGGVSYTSGVKKNLLIMKNKIVLFIAAALFINLCIYLLSMFSESREKDFEFSGKIEKLEFSDYKKTPTVTVNGKSYGLGTSWRFNEKLKVGDSLVKVKGLIKYKLIQSKSKQVIYSD